MVQDCPSPTYLKCMLYIIYRWFQTNNPETSTRPHWMYTSSNNQANHFQNIVSSPIKTTFFAKKQSSTCNATTGAWHCKVEDFDSTILNRCFFQRYLTTRGDPFITGLPSKAFIAAVASSTEDLGKTNRLGRRLRWKNAFWTLKTKRGGGGFWKPIFVPSSTMSMLPIKLKALCQWAFLGYSKFLRTCGKGCTSKITVGALPQKINIASPRRFRRWLYVFLGAMLVEGTVAPHF